MRCDESITVYQAWSSRQAHLLQQLLEAEGIEARVASTAVEFVAGEVPYQMASCPVLVHASELERAAVVVDQFEATLRGAESPFRVDAVSICYHCGELPTSKCAECPACGRELEWSANETADPVRFPWGRLLYALGLFLFFAAIIILSLFG